LIIIISFLIFVLGMTIYHFDGNNCYQHTANDENNNEQIEFEFLVFLIPYFFVMFLTFPSFALICINADPSKAAFTAKVLTQNWQCACDGGNKEESTPSFWQWLLSFFTSQDHNHSVGVVASAEPVVEPTSMVKDNINVKGWWSRLYEWFWGNSSENNSPTTNEFNFSPAKLQEQQVLLADIEAQRLQNMGSGHNANNLSTAIMPSNVAQESLIVLGEDCLDYLPPLDGIYDWAAQDWHTKYLKLQNNEVNQVTQRAVDVIPMSPVPLSYNEEGLLQVNFKEAISLQLISFDESFEGNYDELVVQEYFSYEELDDLLSIPSIEEYLEPKTYYSLLYINEFYTTLLEIGYPEEFATPLVHGIFAQFDMNVFNVSAENRQEQLRSLILQDIEDNRLMFELSLRELNENIANGSIRDDLR